jgi:hypothetical protein
MKIRTKVLTALGTLILTSAVTGGAFAAHAPDKEAMALQVFNSAAISLPQAITAAEQKTGGKAMEAALMMNLKHRSLKSIS